MTNCPDPFCSHSHCTKYRGKYLFQSCGSRNHYLCYPYTFLFLQFSFWKFLISLLNSKLSCFKAPWLIWMLHSANRGFVNCSKMSWFCSNNAKEWATHSTVDKHLSFGWVLTTNWLFKFKSSLIFGNFCRGGLHEYIFFASFQVPSRTIRTISLSVVLTSSCGVKASSWFSNHFCFKKLYSCKYKFAILAQKLSTLY